MKLVVKLAIEFEPNEIAPPEAKAVQQIQNALAAVARLSPDELAAIWRAGLEERRTEGADIELRRTRHSHRAGGAR